MACPHYASCPMFAQFKLKSTLRVWTLSFCEGNYEGCARYQRSQAGQPVPPTLLPNGTLLRGKP